MTPFPSDLRKVVFRFLEDVGTPKALLVKLLIEHEEWVQLVSLRTDPAAYLTPENYFQDAMCTELLRKCEGLPTGIDLAAEALAGFHASEEACCKTNLRLSKFLENGPFETASELSIHEFFVDVKREMSKILKGLPIDLTRSRFGPGATLRDRGRFTTIPDKMSSRPTMTPSVSIFADTFWSDTAWCRALTEDHPDRSDPEIVRGNRFTTVPKDATKNRGIAIEPSLNIFFQLGVGSCLRRRLAECGIDLEEGQTTHMRVACDASQNDDFATIDLSSASDTVSKNLVKLIMPENWYGLLESLRSPTTSVDGRTVFLHKFSSMGNGYTFELETVIFLCLACVIMRRSGIEPKPGHNVWVYGDDIIVPARIVKCLSHVFRFCGLTLNPKKSFSQGYFRESCGGDFFNGVYVRPYYLKEYPNDPQTWIGMANGLRRMAVEHSRSGGHLSLPRSAWFRVLDNIPSHLRRLRGPSQLGDLLIHDNEDRWNFRVKNSIRYFAVYRPITKGLPLSKWTPNVQLACALYGVPSTGPHIRGSVAGYKVGRVPFS